MFEYNLCRTKSELYNDGIQHGINLFQLLHEEVVEDFKKSKSIEHFRIGVKTLVMNEEYNYRDGGSETFQAFVKELDSCPDPDQAWDAYDSGFIKGIDDSIIEFLTQHPWENPS